MIPGDRQDAPYETVVAEVWARVLRQDAESLSAEANFFDLGGSSLQAAATLALLKGQCNVNIALADFFAFPTLGSLASHIEGERRRSEQTDGRLAVTLRRGERELPAVVLIHPHGGSALSYLALVDRLDVPNEIHGVMAQGMESPAPPLESVSDMSELYINALFERGLEEDLILGGWSFGAFVAHEMALTLQARARSPRCLILIDPRLPQHAAPPKPKPLSQLIQETWHIEADQGELLRLAEADRYEYLLQAGIDQERIPPDLTTAILIQRARVREANGAALLRHEPRGGYTGMTHVIRAVGEGPRNRRKITEAWQPLLAGPVAWQDVAGTHGRLLKEPAVQELAVNLQAIIRHASTGEPTLADETNR